MTVVSWWKPAPDDRLNQGDIIADVPFSTLAFPEQYLKLQTFKGGATGYVLSEKAVPSVDNTSPMLARGRVARVVVISHSCDIDKSINDENKADGRPNEKILVAPVMPLSVLAPNQHAHILSRGNVRFMPLPDVQGVGDCFADLKNISSVFSAHLPVEKRIAVMSDEVLPFLHMHLVGYFTRLKMEGAA
jgi:hypothetical protein